MLKPQKSDNVEKNYRAIFFPQNFAKYKVNIHFGIQDTLYWPYQVIRVTEKKVLGLTETGLSRNIISGVA